MLKLVVQVENEPHAHGPTCEHLPLLHASANGSLHLGFLLEDGHFDCLVAQRLKPKGVSKRLHPKVREVWLQVFHRTW
jgi:hypothetical protein